MAFVLPIPLPEVLVRERGVVPANDFGHRHVALAFGPDGRRYLTSELFYNYYRYDSADNRDLNTYLVTIIDAAWNIERVAILEDVMRDITRDDKGGFEFNNPLAPPTVTDAGEVVFSSTVLRSIVLDAELATRVGSLDPGWVLALADGTRIIVRDRDRLSIAAPGGEPRELGSLLKADDSFAIRTEFRDYRGYAGDVTALDGDRIMLSLFTGMSRGGFIDHGAFRYILVDKTGAIVARLPLGEADSPYRPTNGGHHGCFPSQALDGWIVRSEQAFHLFDRDGKRTLRLGLDESLDAIGPLALLGASPTGEIVFVNRKHHTLVITDPVRTAEALAPALLTVAAAYKAEHARLKKAVPWEKGRFFGHEARSTTVASAPAPKKVTKKKPVAVAVVPAPEEPATTDPAFAMALAPHDLDTCAVYGDWLGQRGDALGELVSLHCRIPGAGTDRRRLVGAANVLWKTHGAAWLARWNEPVTLVEPRGPRFAGLPSSVTLESTKDLPAVEAQLARLPIQNIAIRELGAKEIAKLGELPALRRVPRLAISGSSKRKLGGSLVEWLAAANLPRLQALYLYPVETTGRQLRALAEGLPALRELTMSKCDLTIEAIGALADTAAVDRLERLGLAYNPIGSAVMPVLAKFGRLRTLSLHGCDIGDDVAAEPIPEMAVEELDIDGCDRLGPVALATLVRAMPGLRAIEVPSRIVPGHVDALLPIAATLDRLELSFAPIEVVARVAERFLENAPRLTTLIAYEATDLVGALVAHASLVRLTVGATTDADLAALAASRTCNKLETLVIDGGFSDDALVRLARSEHLQHVRELSVTSPAIGTRGIAAALAMPNVESLTIGNATIDDEGPLCARPADSVLRLVRCKISKAKLARLESHWGNLLV